MFHPHVNRWAGVHRSQLFCSCSSKNRADPAGLLPSALQSSLLMSPAPNWALSPRGSRCAHLQQEGFGSTPLGCVQSYSTDGDVENIRDIFQTGLFSYHERV